MTERDKIYASILGFGLSHLRDAARLGLVEYCAIEADHLHNVPSLIGETNELRHRYYFEKEREHYLERVDRSVLRVDFVLARYEELWSELLKLCGEE